MDFLIGIMLIIIAILIIINFTTISISDTKFGSESCSAKSNYLITTMQNGNNLGGVAPVPANLSTTNSGKVNSNNGYDYDKYFFVN
jgi:hypothetical protein